MKEESRMKQLSVVVLYVILRLVEGSCFISPRRNARYYLTGADFGAVIGTSPFSMAHTAMLAMSNTNSKAGYNEKIAACNDILNRAASTRNEDPQLVLSSLEDLEKSFRSVQVVDHI